MNECPSFDYSSIITWVLVVGGWVFVHFQNKVFQERRELRSALDKLILYIDKLKSDAITYHTVESEASSLLSNRVKSAIKNISSSIRRTELGSELVNSEVVAVRKSITLDNFESNDYFPRGHSSALILEIIGSLDDLKDALEVRYVSLYRNSFFSCSRS